MWYYVCDRDNQKFMQKNKKEDIKNIRLESDKSDNSAANRSKMANLLDSIENSAWHAFDFLALEGDGTAQKPKLKVGKFSIICLDNENPSLLKHPILIFAAFKIYEPNILFNMSAVCEYQDIHYKYIIMGVSSRTKSFA